MSSAKWRSLCPGGGGDMLKSKWITDAASKQDASFPLTLQDWYQEWQKFIWSPSELFTNITALIGLS